MKKAIVVFSGGQDSTTCLIAALEEFDEVHTITFNYGQRHKLETEVAQNLAKELNVTSHRLIDVAILNELAVSSLTRNDILMSNKPEKNGLPNSFVPGRNILFLTLAAIYAYQIEVNSIITGLSETDFSGYPDCRNNFVQTLNSALVHGMERNLKIVTPLMWLNKAEIWAMAHKYNTFNFIRNKTLTCYNGIIGNGCEDCYACKLRQTGLLSYLQNSEFVMANYLEKTGSSKRKRFYF
ncbi:7-cyano-7-deazaguanine synthase [Candidatus Photodesmus blepharus]|uniref:7-cyano-7-deazaguanine synthase n=1 Tax=Candidatus Photodesmus blepharonis TaxID=1179155 RepID=A0A084CM90_9GAMM|nr:7-cyano-7-deazaguanine synthase QueC [Candidatus Photodesmus blepharus]KEY90919.1 7-cyano-7-deazaguanine synthase [Candidatus Photodesmus blepharus]